MIFKLCYCWVYACRRVEETDKPLQEQVWEKGPGLYRVTCCAFFFSRFISLTPNPLPVVVVVLLDLEGSLPTLIYSLTKCNACVAS